MVAADFARQLERELGEANITIQNINEGRAHLANVIDDRDRWKAMAEELASELDDIHGWHSVLEGSLHCRCCLLLARFNAMKGEQKCPEPKTV